MSRLGRADWGMLRRTSNVPSPHQGFGTPALRARGLGHGAHAHTTIRVRAKMSKDVEQFGLREAINVHLKCLRVRSELLSRLLLLLLLLLLLACCRCRCRCCCRAAATAVATAFAVASR